MGIGDWGLGIGDWGLGIGPNPQSPIPNPQIPNPQSPLYQKNEFKNLYILYYLIIYITKILTIFLQHRKNMCLNIEHYLLF
jgi:hypothetical protein